MLHVSPAIRKLLPSFIFPTLARLFCLLQKKSREPRNAEKRTCFMTTQQRYTPVWVGNLSCCEGKKHSRMCVRVRPTEAKDRGNKNEGKILFNSKFCFYFASQQQHRASHTALRETTKMRFLGVGFGSLYVPLLSSSSFAALDSCFVSFIVQQRHKKSLRHFDSSSGWKKLCTSCIFSVCRSGIMSASFGKWTKTEAHKKFKMEEEGEDDGRTKEETS